MESCTTRRMFCTSLVALPLVGLVSDSAHAGVTKHPIVLEVNTLVRIKLEAKPSGRFGSINCSLVQNSGGVRNIIQAIATKRVAFQGMYGPFKLWPSSYDIEMQGGAFTYRIAIEIAKQLPTGEYGDYETLTDTTGSV